MTIKFESHQLGHSALVLIESCSVGKPHRGKRTNPRSLSHVHTHTYTNTHPEWFSFSPNLQGCDLAYVPAMTGRGVKRWSRRCGEQLDTQRGGGSAFCHKLGSDQPQGHR